MALRMTEEEYAAFELRRKLVTGITGTGRPAPAEEEKPRKSKYGNRKVIVEGMKFDSQKEADFYFGVLLPRIRAGELKYVLRQVPFDLPGGIQYIADYVAVDPMDRVEGVYDVKSAATRKIRTYINKKKQMKACNGVVIIEI